MEPAAVGRHLATGVGVDADEGAPRGPRNLRLVLGVRSRTRRLLTIQVNTDYTLALSPFVQHFLGSS